MHRDTVSEGSRAAAASLHLDRYQAAEQICLAEAHPGPSRMSSSIARTGPTRRSPPTVAESNTLICRRWWDARSWR